MTKRILPTLLAMATAALPLPALSAAVESTIDRVTVYPGHLARVERVTRFDAGDRDGSVVFDGLPAAMDPDSVRVAVESGALRIGAVEVAHEPVGEATRERERALREELAALEARRQTALDRVAAARTQLTFIEGLAGLPEGEGAAEALTAGEGARRWSTLWERIGEGARNAREAMRGSEREAAALKEEIDALQRRLDQLGGAREERVRVTVAYDADAPTRAELRLVYRVRGPRWQPLYEARLDTAGGGLELVRSARVSQATGEEWRDVRLTLSTAQPVHGDGPDPATWWIDLAPPPEPADDTADVAKLRQEARGMAAPAAEAGAARTVGAEFATRYEIPGRVSVPAGNQPRVLQIASSALSASVGAHVFPQQDTTAWLTADATWDGAGPLPAGPVSRFLDGAYVGRGQLASWPPGAERDLAFGIDPRVDVRFEPVRDEAGEAGWISTQSTLARRYRLTVTNRHDRALPVTALFRVPVPRDEAIELTEAFSRPPTRRDIDDRRGIHAWELDLDADESTSLELGFEVRYPEDRELDGIR